MSAFVAFVAKYKWWILGIILSIIVLLYIRKNWFKIRHFFQPGDIDIETGEPINISKARETQLEAIASELYQDIYDTPISFYGLAVHTEEIYNRANALSDIELRYLAKYYKRYLSDGNTLYMDLEGEYTSPWSNYISALQAHLAKIGEK